MREKDKGQSWYSTVQAGQGWYPLLRAYLACGNSQGAHCVAWLWREGGVVCVHRRRVLPVAGCEEAAAHSPHQELIA